MDRLNGMEVFAKVAEAGGFSAAARDLGISKPAVSKAVMALEEHLGVRLFNRTTRRVSLTEVGKAYYGWCTRIIADVEEAELAVTRLHAEPRGNLRVNAPMSFGILHVGPCLPDFLGRYPDLSVDLELNDRFVDVVEEGYDVVIRIGDLSDSSLIARRLATSNFVLCGAPDYFARHGEPRHPRDLVDHNCLQYSYLRSARGEWRFDGPEGEVRVKVKGNVTANNGDVLRGAILRGAGICIAPTFIVGPDLCAGRLRAVMRDWTAETGIYAVYPHNRHLSAKVRAFVDFLIGRFGPAPYWDDETRTDELTGATS